MEYRVSAIGAWVSAAGMVLEAAPGGANPCRCTAATSKALVFLGGSEAWEGVAGGIALGFDAGEGFALGTGFSQDHDGAEGFGIDTGDEVGVAGAVFFPKLANLDFGNGHGCKPRL